MSDIATKIHHASLGATPVVVSTDSIWIYGVYVSNTSGVSRTATLQTTEAVPTTLLVFNQVANGFSEFETPFPADNGVQWAAGDATQKVTVLWRPSG